MSLIEVTHRNMGEGLFRKAWSIYGLLHLGRNIVTLSFHQPSMYTQGRVGPHESLPTL